MNKILKIVTFMLFIPSLAFAANGYWDSMIWEQDDWYMGLGRITGKITTRVTGANTPIYGAAVTLSETGQNVKTGTDGTYTLNDVPEGKHTVMVQMNGFSTLQLKDIQITEGATVNLSGEEMTFGLKGDINDDGKIGLEEAIRALQIVSGIVK